MRFFSQAEPLWRSLVVRERVAPICDHPASVAAPQWAPERRSSPGADEPLSATWRQAYRLLALWERGRPGGLKARPRIVGSFEPAEQAPCATDEERSHRAQRTYTGQAIYPYLAARTATNEASLASLLPTHPHTRWEVTETSALLGLRSSRGHVYVFESSREKVRFFPLPTQRQGRLASRVRLSVVRTFAGGKDDVSVATDTVFCLTRSGRTWTRWDWRRGRSICQLPGRFGKVVILGNRACWLGWNDRSKTNGVDRLGLWDARTGEAIVAENVNHKLAGCSLLTPDYGPLVAWSPQFHFRVLWTTCPRTAELPDNPTKQQMRGNRPVYVEVDFALPGVDLLVGQDVLDVVADDQVPGRLRLLLTPAERTQSKTSLFVEGWGQHAATWLDGSARAGGDDAGGPVQPELVA